MHSTAVHRMRLGPKFLISEERLLTCSDHEKEVPFALALGRGVSLSRAPSPAARCLASPPGVKQPDPGG